MWWSWNDASGWEKERTGVDFGDEQKPKGRAVAHRAYVPGKMRPHQVMELLLPQMPIWVASKVLKNELHPVLEET